MKGLGILAQGKLTCVSHRSDKCPKSLRDLWRSVQERILSHKSRMHLPATKRHKFSFAWVQQWKIVVGIQLTFLCKSSLNGFQTVLHFEGHTYNHGQAQ